MAGRFVLCWRSFDNPSNRIIRAARDQGLGGQLLTSLRRLSHSEEGSNDNIDNLSLWRAQEKGLPRDESGRVA
jgi:hypothetical protein